MLEIILLSHAKTQAQIKGYFPGNIDLDSNISFPVDFTIPLNDGILCSNFLPAVKTAEHFGVPFIIDKNIPVPDYGQGRLLIITDASVIRMVILTILQAPLASLFDIDVAPLALIRIVSHHKGFILKF